MRIFEIQEKNNIDLTNSSQHGFKKKHSTASLSLKIQSLIAHALDDNDVSVMASLDLSAALISGILVTNSVIEVFVFTPI